MNKTELINAIAEGAGLSKADAAKALNATTAAIANAVKAGDKVAFTAAVLKLYNNRELCEEYGKNGREFIMKNLTRAVGTQKYVDVIKSFEK